MKLYTLDIILREKLREIRVPLARFGIFLIFFWFGILKIFGLSPATPLVKNLFLMTLDGVIDFNVFITIFGVFEVLIGLLFLKKGFERIVLPLLLLHMITTSLPLFLLPHQAWVGILIPTLEGQYIIKNIVVIATAFFIASSLHPIKISKKISHAIDTMI